AWIGGGEVDGRLQQGIQAAGLAQRIEFTGYLEAPHTLLRQASCLFLTSRDDPFPLSVLEAMSLARSVITFDVGGAPEALAGSGIVLPPFDTAAAAEAILELLRQPAAARLRPAARARYLAEYTPQRFAARLAPLLLGEIDDE
ncbi:MAG: glycosyltransferase family 4 protein, partial [Anaerolineales bacterium]|nr:glycosyltransferase family 4 protein [Anaerolineales bacterium]